MGAGRGTFACHLKSNQLARGAAFLGLLQDVATDEILFRQVDKKSEAGLDWIALWRQIGAVQRVTHLESQRVARAESARFDPKRLSVIKDGVPDHGRVFGGEENLHAVFTGVTRASDRQLYTLV